MLTINQTRTYKHPVTVSFYDDEGNEKSGTFNAVFKILPTNKITEFKGSLLDAVLVSVSDLAMNDCDGKPLADSEILTAVKLDPQVSIAIVSTYNESIVKKNLRQI